MSCLQTDMLLENSNLSNQWQVLAMKTSLCMQVTTPQLYKACMQVTTPQLYKACINSDSASDASDSASDASDSASNACNSASNATPVSHYACTEIIPSCSCWKTVWWQAIQPAAPPTHTHNMLSGSLQTCGAYLCQCWSSQSQSPLGGGHVADHHVSATPCTPESLGPRLPSWGLCLCPFQCCHCCSHCQMQCGHRQYRRGHCPCQCGLWKQSVQE